MIQTQHGEHSTEQRISSTKRYVWVSCKRVSWVVLNTCAHCWLLMKVALWTRCAREVYTIGREGWVSLSIASKMLLVIADWHTQRYLAMIQDPWHSKPVITLFVGTTVPHLWAFKILTFITGIIGGSYIWLLCLVFVDLLHWSANSRIWIWNHLDLFVLDFKYIGIQPDENDFACVTGALCTDTSLSFVHQFLSVSL